MQSSKLLFTMFRERMKIANPSSSISKLEIRAPHIFQHHAELSAVGSTAERGAEILLHLSQLAARRTKSYSRYASQTWQSSIILACNLCGVNLLFGDQKINIRNDLALKSTLSKKSLDWNTGERWRVKIQLSLQYSTLLFVCSFCSLIRAKIGANSWEPHTWHSLPCLKVALESSIQRSRMKIEAVAFLEKEEHLKASELVRLPYVHKHRRFNEELCPVTFHWTFTLKIQITFPWPI